MIKIGILGAGFMGRGHYDRYQKIPGVQVTAWADVEAERRKGVLLAQGNIDLGLKKLDLSGVTSYAGAAQLIAKSDVDVVDVCLPTYLHSRYAVAALQSGKHVFCEKPMALSLSQADAMIEAAAANRRTLMIGQCIRFWPEYLYLKKLIESQELGKPLSLRFSRMGTAPLWSWQGWMLDAKKSGGAILDLHIHDVDFVHYMLGKPRAIYAQGGNAGSTTGEDFVEAVYDYPDIPRVTIEAGWMRGGLGFQAGYDAWFEGGFLRYRGWETPALSLYLNDGKEPTHPQAEPGDAYSNELLYFVECLNKGLAPTRCLPESARDSLALIFAEQKSLRKKALVRL
jgi:predicted dehydrogenase